MIAVFIVRKTELSRIPRIGQLANGGTKPPSSTQVFSFLSKGPHPEPAGSRMQHSSTHLEPRPAGALRDAPRPQPSAPGTSGRPRAAPPSSRRSHPRPVQRGAQQAVRADPWRRQAQCCWGRSLCASLWGAGFPARSRGAPRARTPMHRRQQSPRCASVKARGPGRHRERGLARGSGPPWPAACRVQTGPRQPNPAARARGLSQG